MTIESEVRLFVDDQRGLLWMGLCPEDGWVIARTSEEAIKILNECGDNIVEVWLDHDLGGEDTGYKVICWMEQNDVWPRDGVRCHSANPVGRQRIESVINRRYRPGSCESMMTRRKSNRFKEREGIQGYTDIV